MIRTWKFFNLVWRWVGKRTEKTATWNYFHFSFWNLGKKFQSSDVPPPVVGALFHSSCFAVPRPSIYIHHNLPATWTATILVLQEGDWNMVISDRFRRCSISSAGRCCFWDGLVVVFLEFVLLAKNRLGRLRMETTCIWVMYSFQAFRDWWGWGYSIRTDSTGILLLRTMDAFRLAPVSNSKGAPSKRYFN